MVLKDSIFFPDRIFRLNLIRTFFILNCYVDARILIQRGLQPSFELFITCIAVFLISILCLLPTVVFLSWRAPKNLAKLTSMVNDPNYHPIRVTVKKPTFLEKANYYINGRLIRTAIDTSGKKYRVEYRKNAESEFEAYLFIQKGWLIRFGGIGAVVPVGLLSAMRQSGKEAA